MVSSDLRALRLEVASLKEDKAPLIEEMLARYESNRVRIAEAGFPIIAFCGHGRSGNRYIPIERHWVPWAIRWNY